MPVPFTRSGLRRMFEAISEQVRKEWLAEHPEPYGPPTEEQMKVERHNARLVVELQEQLLDVMPNVEPRRK